ncbi:MAG: protein kinase, partial [Myxococcota bacterium]
MALKVLRGRPGEGSVTQATRQRLMREARAMAKIRHRNVIIVHDVQTIDEIDFVAMELIEGGNLAQWLGDEPRSWREIVEVYLAAGAGLAAAHKVGLVHRDFKPANVLVGKDGRVVVTDFGLARTQGEMPGRPVSRDSDVDRTGAASSDDSVGSGRRGTGADRRAASGSALTPEAIQVDPGGPTALHPRAISPGVAMPVTPGGLAGDLALEATVHADDISLTRTGMVVGTPAYMAPEQHLGHAVDARADQFSFCVALYEGLYSRRPFLGDSFTELRDAILCGAPLSLPRRPRLPGPVRHALRRGLRRDAEARFPSMEALLAELRRGLGVRRRRLLIAATTAALAIAVAIGGALGGFVERKAPMAAVYQCETTAERFAELWNDRVARDLQQSFDDSGSTCSNSALVGVTDRFADFHRAWLEVHDEVCQSPQDGEQELVFHRRMGCLLDQRQRFTTLLDELGHADAEAVEHAVESSTLLPRPEQCRNGDSSSLVLNRPEAPDEERIAVVEMRGQLAELAALNAVGRGDGVAERARAIIERAQALDHKPLEALALLRLGESRIAVGATEDARVALLKAVHVAEHGLRDDLVARARVALAELAVAEPGSSEVAEALRRARMAVDRHRDLPELHGRLLAAEARALHHAGQPGRALAALTRAKAAFEQAGLRMRAARIMAKMAHIHAEQHRTQSAVDLVTAAER